MKSIYKKIILFIAKKIFNDALGFAWEDAYRVGFEEGTDSQTSPDKRFAAGYVIGYEDAVQGYSPQHTSNHSQLKKKFITIV